MEINFEELGCNFGDWLVEQEYWTVEDNIRDQNELIEDLKKAYAVAPGLVHILRDIADR